MYVFISSVRRGLEEERDSLAGQIRALGHEPIVFEDFPAQSVPSREACLRAAEAADVYILLLGPYYGTVFPETGTSPTRDEHTVAARRGIPRVVMHKMGVNFEPAQQEFANQVERYTTGLFRGEFSTATELLIEVTRVIREIEASPKALTWRTLRQPLPHTSFKINNSQDFRSAVVLHCIPIEEVRLSSMELRYSTERMIRAIRGCQLVSEATPLDSSTNADASVVKVGGTSVRWGGFSGLNDVTPATFGGAQLDQEVRFDAWSFLARDTLGSVIDETSLAEELRRLVGLAGLLNVTFGNEVALATRLVIAGAINEGNPVNLGSRNSASMLMSRPADVTTDIDDAVPAASLAAGQAEIGRELARRLLAKFRELR